MSFLFGKKKSDKQEKSGAPLSTRDGPPTGGTATPVPGVNGVRSKVQSPAPGPNGPNGPSVNNSANSVEVTNTPSPEHGREPRGAIDHDLQVRLSCGVQTALDQSQCAFCALRTAICNLSCSKNNANLWLRI